MQPKKLLPWAGLFSFTILSVYAYFGLEWLFFATKPSFLNALPFFTQVGILALAALLMIVICAAPLLLLFAASRVLPERGARWLLWLGGVIPAAFFACAALILVDNFTYTMFKFGIVTSAGVWRGLYGIAFLAVLIMMWIYVKRALDRTDAPARALPWQVKFCAVLLALSLAAGLPQLFTARSAAYTGVTGAAKRTPNILLIGSDGLDSRRMSLYGYSRDTTPFLKEFARTSLLSENNFPNATITTGSLVSIFTGKLPTTTRVLYPPDILKGADAYQHLPGILKAAGYYNSDITVEFYGDSSTLNLQNSFVDTNGRAAVNNALYAPLRQALPENTAYFFSVLGTRLAQRMLHIFYLRKMENPYAQVTQVLNVIPDQDRANQVLYTFRNNPGPIFMHVHMMGTHEGNLSPKNDTWTKGLTPSDENEWEFYDNAILDFDGYMKQVVTGLAQMGALDNTVIIVYTDHGFFDVSSERTPLLFHFPGGEHAGRITHNTQNLDIAPTILSYLGLSQPDWMAGQSLLGVEPPANRPIFSAAPGNRDQINEGRLVINTAQTKPPFYQFGVIGMVVCQEVYSLDTARMAWQAAEVPGYPAPCPASELPTDEQARAMLMEQLRRDGFEVK